MKKRKLRTWVKIVLFIILVLLIEQGIESYNDYLEQCDKTKGYNCNIFGK